MSGARICPRCGSPYYRINVMHQLSAPGAGAAAARQHGHVHAAPQEAEGRQPRREDAQEEEREEERRRVVLDDEAVLVCSPTEGRASSSVPGSARRHCARCEREVFVAPSSLTLMRRYRQVTVICVPCAERMPPPRDAWAPLTPQQLREIIDGLRDGDAPR